MPRDKTESHEKILAAARKEFMQYGFKDASMRRIGEEAGLTAAALYRHFAGKEALFGAVVEPAVHDIYAWIDAMRPGRRRLSGPAGKISGRTRKSI